MKKTMRILLALLAALIMAFTAAQGESLKTDGEIIDGVMENFLQLAKVPRPSHHEEKISAFLMGWARERGLEPVQDQALNVMFEVPATEGYEEYPLGILQGHMDMVVAVTEGKTFDPLEDPITPVMDKAAGTLTADGTSLGADDGIGVALIMAVTEGKMDHGPIRVIVTVDEEDGMTGASNLDPSWLEGAEFLINLDNETSTAVLVSTAAGDTVQVNRELTFTEPTGDFALTVKLSRLKGGHSGVEIDKGRLNGLVGLASFLQELRANGVRYELASMKGGNASNAIPTGAEAVIVIRSEDRQAVEDAAAAFLARLKETYEGIEDEMELTVSPLAETPRVIPEEDAENALRYITEVIDGVYTWSKDLPGMVESSSNLGLFSLDGNGLTASGLERSSSPEKEEEILEAQRKLAEACGLTFTRTKTADAWPFDPDSRLLEKVKRVYLEQNGEAIEVQTLHAGLECGTFKALNPDLDMISIGPDLTDVHTVKETLRLDSVPRIWRLLEGILTAKMD